MTAYIVVSMTPKNAEKMQEYAAQAGKTFGPFNGKVMAKGPVESLHGEVDYSTKVILAFPSKQEALGWYGSDAYQALLATRNAGMDSQFHLIG